MKVFIGAAGRMGAPQIYSPRDGGRIAIEGRPCGVGAGGAGRANGIGGPSASAFRAYVKRGAFPFAKGAQGFSGRGSKRAADFRQWQPPMHYEAVLENGSQKLALPCESGGGGLCSAMATAKFMADMEESGASELYFMDGGSPWGAARAPKKGAAFADGDIVAKKSYVFSMEKQDWVPLETGQERGPHGKKGKKPRPRTAS